MAVELLRSRRVVTPRKTMKIAIPAPSIGFLRVWSVKEWRDESIALEVHVADDWREASANDERDNDSDNEGQELDSRTQGGAPADLLNSERRGVSINAVSDAR